MAEWSAKTLCPCSTSTPGSTMDPCAHCEGISEGSSSSNDSLWPGGQCWEELWMPNLQPTASHNPGDTTQQDNPDTLQHVFTDTLEDISSNFDAAITSVSLPETEDGSPATLAHDLASFESEDFDMWLKAFSASLNTEYGLIEPESSETPLFPVESHPTFPGNAIGDEYCHTDAGLHNSLPSSYLSLANNVPYVMDVNSPSAPKSFSGTPGFNDYEKSNGSEMGYQLIRKLAPAAEAQFMIRQNPTSNNDQLLVPATEQRKRRQCFDPLKREKVKQVRRLGACIRCRVYKEPVSYMLGLLFVVD